MRPSSGLAIFSDHCVKRRAIVCTCSITVGVKVTLMKFSTMTTIATLGLNPSMRCETHTITMENAIARVTRTDRHGNETSNTNTTQHRTQHNTMEKENKHKQKGKGVGKEEKRETKETRTKGNEK